MELKLQGFEIFGRYNGKNSSQFTQFTKEGEKKFDKKYLSVSPAGKGRMLMLADESREVVLASDSKEFKFKVSALFGASSFPLLCVVSKSEGDVLRTGLQNEVRVWDVSELDAPKLILSSPTATAIQEEILFCDRGLVTFIGE